MIRLVSWERLGSPGEWAIFTSKPIPGLTSFDPKKEGMIGGPFRPDFHDTTPYLYGLAETSPTLMFGLLPMDSVDQCVGTYSNCYKHQVNIKRSCELEDADSKKQKQGQPDEVFKEDALQSTLHGRSTQCILSL